MIAFPAILVKPAADAGMKVPDDPDSFDASKYPHFNVYLKVQIGAPMPSPISHWTNARIIASVSDERIRMITYDELKELGLEVGYPIP